MIGLSGSLKRGIKNVLRSPVRLALVVVLLGTSLTFTAAMVAMNSGSQNQLADVQKQIGTGIEIRPPFSGFGFNAGTLTNKQIKKAESVPGIIGVTESVSQRYQGTDIAGAAKLPAQFQQFAPPSGSGSRSGGFPGAGQGGNRAPRRPFNTAKNGTIPPTITGVTGSAAKVTLTGGGTVKITKGKDLFPSDSKSQVAVAGAALAKANNWKIGSTFKLSGYKVKLIGEYTTGQSFGDNTMIVPLKFAQKLFKINGITDLTVYAGNASQVNGIAAKLQSSLGSNVQVVTQNQFYQSTFAALNATSKNVQAALIASIIAAALVIIFAVFIIVRERTREIGVLKAIGASSLNIVSQFTAEVLTLSASAAIVAAVLLAVFGNQIAKAFQVSTANPPNSGFPGGGGVPGGGGFSGTFRAFRQAAAPNPVTHTINASLTLESLLILLAMAIGLAVVASWIPSWYVSRVQPARVLSQA
jgi:putative ABC transport system permease protein